MRACEAAGEEVEEELLVALAESMACAESRNGYRVYRLKEDGNVVEKASQAVADADGTHSTVLDCVLVGTENGCVSKERSTGKASGTSVVSSDSVVPEGVARPREDAATDGEGADGHGSGAAAVDESALAALAHIAAEAAPCPRDAVVLEEAAAFLSCGTTGLQTWTAAQVLAGLVSRPPWSHRLAGAHVLELGAGPGLAGLAAAHAAGTGNGLARLTLTDASDHVLDLLRRNASRNLPPKSPAVVTVCPLDWRDPIAAAVALTPVDVILGSDLVFDPMLVPSLVDTVTALLAAAPATAVAWIASTHRNPETYAAFVAALEAEDTLTVSTVPFGVHDSPIVLDHSCEVTVLEIARVP